MRRAARLRWWFAAVCVFAGAFAVAAPRRARTTSPVRAAPPPAAVNPADPGARAGASRDRPPGASDAPVSTEAPSTEAQPAAASAVVDAGVAPAVPGVPAPAQALALAPPPPPPGDGGRKPRLFVNDLAAQGVSPAQAAALTDAVVAVLAKRGLFDIVGQRDLQATLGMQRQRDLLGVCESHPEQCARDFASALSAPIVLSGQLSRVGAAFQLTLQMTDTLKAQPVARSTRFAPSLEALQALVPYAAAEATGSPLPPPPSRVLPVTLLSVGGATVLSGGVVALLAFTKQSTLNEELCPTAVAADGSCTGVNLRPRAYYVEQEQLVQRQSWLGAGLALAGGVLMAAGLWLMPPPQASPGGFALLVRPTAGGLALAGGF